MALTMTRTRTQTTLTRLTKLLANLNGELEFIERLTLERPDSSEALILRRQVLAENRAAVCITIRQFDPDVDLASVGSLNDWAKEYRRRGRSMEAEYARRLPGPAAVTRRR
jgi:hypothetical protein